MGINIPVNVVTPTGLNDKKKKPFQAFAEASDLKVNPKKRVLWGQSALDDL